MTLPTEGTDELLGGCLAVVALYSAITVALFVSTHPAMLLACIVAAIVGPYFIGRRAA